jgi:hypothetical protein
MDLLLRITEENIYYHAWQKTEKKNESSLLHVCLHTSTASLQPPCPQGGWEGSGDQFFSLYLTQCEKGRSSFPFSIYYFFLFLLSTITNDLVKFSL